MDSPPDEEAEKKHEARQHRMVGHLVREPDLKRAAQALLNLVKVKSLEKNKVFTPMVIRVSCELLIETAIKEAGFEAPPADWPS